MKILLICPVPPRRYWPQGIFRNTFVPTGVAQIATVFRTAGHDARLYLREEHLCKLRMDWSAADAHVRDTIRRFAPDVLGVSLCTPMLAETQQLAAMTRELLGTGPLIVAGGPHATAMPAQTLRQCPGLDAVVIGEGEQTMLELVERGPASDVNGLAFRDGEEIRLTPPRPLLKDLDRLPPIDYGLLDMNYYTAPSRWLIRWLELSATNIRTSRGCTNRCAFCGGHLVAGVGVGCIRCSTSQTASATPSTAWACEGSTSRMTPSAPTATG